MKKLIYSLVIILVSITSFFMYQYLDANDVDGTITVIVIDESGNEIINDEIGFLLEDELFDLIETSYEVGCANSNYKLSDDCEATVLQNRVLLKINEVETDWMNTYIAIYVNDEYSTKGIDLIPLKDGNTYTFKALEVGDDVN